MSTIIKKISNRVLLLVLIAFLILSVYFIHHSYQTHIKTAADNQLEKLHSIAKTLSPQIDGVKLKMCLEMFPQQNDISYTTQNQYYREQHELLQKAQQLNGLETPIYTLTYDSLSEEFIFGVTSNEEPYWRHEYRSAPETLKERYEEGGKISRFEDEHGTWLSAFHPVKDEEGDVVGVIMVDRRFEEFIMEARSALYRNVSLALGLFFIVGFGLVRSVRSILKEEEKVKEDLQVSKRHIEEKNKELHKLSLVASKTDNIILIVAPDGEIEWINEHYTRKVGYTLQELKTMKGRTIFESSNNPRIGEAVRTAIAERRSVSYECRNEARDGEIFWTNTTLTPVFDESEEVQHLIIVDSDITELKEAEEEIKAKNQAITSSIDYAARIQTSIVPNKGSLAEHFRDIMVIHRPKDVVSGDFYWFTRFPSGLKVIAMVDCTGHGVPGAMMSILSHSLLNDLVDEEMAKDPANILEKLNERVIAALKQGSKESRSSDGMDLSLCTIDEKGKELLYAGAYRPLIRIREGELEIHKGDRHPVGSAQYPIDRKFTNHRTPYEEGDAIYLFSDGFPDQFGGPKKKKYGEKRFRETLLSLSDKGMNGQEEELERIFEEWMGDEEQIDDVTVIGIRL